MDFIKLIDIREMVDNFHLLFNFNSITWHDFPFSALILFSSLFLCFLVNFILDIYIWVAIVNGI